MLNLPSDLSFYICFVIVDNGGDDGHDSYGEGRVGRGQWGVILGGLEFDNRLVEFGIETFIVKSRINIARL